jgi:hypothetical protein
MKEYQIDCNKFCGFVKVDDNELIIDVLPIARKFVGQPISNLIMWTQTHFGYCTLTELNKQGE